MSYQQQPNQGGPPGNFYQGQPQPSQGGYPQYHHQAQSQYPPQGREYEQMPHAYVYPQQMQGQNPYAHHPSQQQFSQQRQQYNQQYSSQQMGFPQQQSGYPHQMYQSQPQHQPYMGHQGPPPHHMQHHSGHMGHHQPQFQNPHMHNQGQHTQQPSQHQRFGGGGQHPQHQQHQHHHQQHNQQFQPQNHRQTMDTAQQQSSAEKGQMMQNQALNGMASYAESCIFFGNIPYDAGPAELQETFKMAGPFSIFRLKIDSERKQPKGFGFCCYKDPDVASSALRNLKKYEIMGRALKVDFASDNKNGNNLKREDVLYRDSAEVIKISGNSTGGSQQQNSSLACEVLDSQTSTVDEMFDNLSVEQEQMLLAALKEVAKHTQEKEGDQAHRALIEALANDETMLKRLTDMLEKQRNRGVNGGNGSLGGGGGGHRSNGGYMNYF